jgi:hypothetical protein
MRAAITRASVAAPYWVCVPVPDPVWQDAKVDAVDTTIKTSGPWQSAAGSIASFRVKESLPAAFAVPQGNRSPEVPLPAQKI